MNRKLLIAALESIFMIALLQLCCAQDTCPRPRLISVVGTAEINVAPEEAFLSLGVESRDKLLSTAKSQNDARVKKVLTVARTTGVEEKYIKTSALQMSPDYSDEKVPRLLGYQVSQTIAITLKDLSKYEGLITQLLEAGVNRVDGISFQVGESRKYRDEARSQAVAAAKEKATAMAKELGQAVGKSWEVSEEGDDRDKLSIMAGAVNTRYAYNTGGGAAESTVAPGQVTVRASIRVSFQLE
jgi:uncharacterized protein YggE